MKPSQTNALSAGQAKASLAAMLMMSRDLDRLAIESLARSYRVPRRQIEQMLAAERLRRAGA